MEDDDRELIERAENLLEHLDEEQERTGQIDHLGRLAWCNTFGRGLIRLAKHEDILVYLRTMLESLRSSAPDDDVPLSRCTAHWAKRDLLIEIIAEIAGEEVE